MAHAVVVQVALDPDSDARHRQVVLRDIVVPEVRASTGFRHGMWLNDGNGEGTCIVVFDTAQDAAGALALLTPATGPVIRRSGVHEVEIDI